MAKILLAEDDRDLRTFLERALEKAGHEVTSFGEGASAFECIKTGAFALLLTGETDVEGAWQALASRWQEIDAEGGSVLYREVPYSGLVGVTRSGGEIIGVANAADEEQLLDRLGRIAAP